MRSASARAKLQLKATERAKAFSSKSEDPDAIAAGREALRHKVALARARLQLRASERTKVFSCKSEDLDAIAATEQDVKKIIVM